MMLKASNVYSKHRKMVSDAEGIEQGNEGIHAANSTIPSASVKRDLYFSSSMPSAVDIIDE